MVGGDGIVVGDGIGIGDGIGVGDGIVMSEKAGEGGGEAACHTLSLSIERPSQSTSPMHAGLVPKPSCW